MTDNVFPLYGRCYACKKALRRPPEKVVFTDEGEEERPLCSGCLESSLQYLARNQHIYNALLMLGVSREIADAMMNAKVDVESEQLKKGKKP